MPRRRINPMSLLPPALPGSGERIRMPHAPLADDAPKDIHRGIHPPGSITRPRLLDTTARPHLRLAVSRSSSPALTDPARQVAGLTLRLPDGRGTELRVLAGKAGARITHARCF